VEKIKPTDFNCTNAFKDNKNKCNKINCRYRINDVKHKNCAIIAANKSDYTLQEIGEMFNLTRMRIFQIEKAVIEKLKNEHFKDLIEFTTN
jgi:DNA-directed RNA polymerase specialized sigma subunit